MIKLYPQLWYVKTNHRKNDKDLAYLCHYEDNAAFEKRESTGLRWANNLYRYGYNEKKEKLKQSEGVIADNLPVNGFEIVQSVSRWSTSNKLIRIKDPRGFVCEISTDNLIGLLKTASIVNCVVQEDCVWGREGGNNVLLPVNSEPYLDAVKNTEKAKESLKPMSMRDVKPGDIIEFATQDNSEWIYLGRGKPDWTCTRTKYRTPRKDSSLPHVWGYPNTETDEVLDVHETTIRADKAVHIFVQPYPYATKDKYHHKRTTSPKVLKVKGKSDELDKFRARHYNEWYPDNAMRDKFETAIGSVDNYSFSYARQSTYYENEYKIVGAEWAN